MTLSDDVLSGARDIGSYIGKSERAVYHLPAKRQLPVFFIGKKMHSRKSELERAFSAQAA